MPAYNEADGITGFLSELVTTLVPATDELSIIVLDDVSTDDTAARVCALARDVPQVRVVTAPRNAGHGPTAIRAYREGLALDPDALIHVDGDGQFLAEDFLRVLDPLDEHDVVHGVRTGRTDPWFRRVLTAMVGAVVFAAARHRVPDVNTPLRAYRPPVIARLLDRVPADALVPHVHFSLAEPRLGLRVAYVEVQSIPRRGGDAVGTMWGGGVRAPRLPPRSLRLFARRAAVELWQVSIRGGRRADVVARS